MDCSICFEPMNNPAHVRTTACHHSFHRTCLERWLFPNYSCPICRRFVPREQPARSAIRIMYEDSERIVFFRSMDEFDNFRRERNAGWGRNYGGGYGGLSYLPETDDDDDDDSDFYIPDRMQSDISESDMDDDEEELIPEREPDRMHLNDSPPEYLIPIPETDDDDELIPEPEPDRMHLNDSPPEPETLISVPETDENNDEVIYDGTLLKYQDMDTTDEEVRLVAMIFRDN